MNHLTAWIERITGVDERTSRLSALILTVVVVSCAVPSVAAVTSTWWQTAQLERDQAEARKGYMKRTDAIIANHQTIIHNEMILCKAAGHTDCISTVAKP